MEAVWNCRGEERAEPEGFTDQSTFQLLPMDMISG